VIPLVGEGGMCRQEIPWVVFYVQVGGGEVCVRCCVPSFFGSHLSFELHYELDVRYILLRLLLLLFDDFWILLDFEWMYTYLPVGASLQMYWLDSREVECSTIPLQKVLSR
jgi:hypothetical protein